MLRLPPDQSTPTARWSCPLPCPTALGHLRPDRQIDLFGESTRGNLHFASSDEEDRPPTTRRRIDDVLGLRCCSGWLICCG